MLAKNAQLKSLQALLDARANLSNEEHKALMSKLAKLEAELNAITEAKEKLAKVTTP